MKKFLKTLGVNFVLLVLAIFASDAQSCEFVEQTQDRCKSNNRIWLGQGIDANAYKGRVSTYKLSPARRELFWFCRHDKARVAWRRAANTLRVIFRHNGLIIWLFQDCLPPGCQTSKPPQKTSDKCRGGEYLWLADGIEKSVPKGKGDDTIEISRGMRELRWYCGYFGQKRVAWGGDANRLRVHFYTNGRIAWEFFTCNPLPECYNNDHLNIKLEKLYLKTDPTDTVAFGWEFLFGSPSDEIFVNLESKYCYKRSQTREIKKYETKYYRNPPVSLRYIGEPVKFWLTEVDSGFEGRNDYSEIITIPTAKFDIMQRYLKKNPGLRFELDYSVKVKGKNIFQERKWLGLLAGKLCINALDYVLGPWTGRLLSKNMARLYQAVIKTTYLPGKLKDKKIKIFKSVMKYQIIQNFKESISLNPLDVIKDVVLDSSRLDDELKQAVRNRVGSNWSNVFDKVIEFISLLDELTGIFEFCLTDILPPAKDALYDVYFTVGK